MSSSNIPSSIFRCWRPTSGFYVCMYVCMCMYAMYACMLPGPSMSTETQGCYMLVLRPNRRGFQKPRHAVKVAVTPGSRGNDSLLLEAEDQCQGFRGGSQALLRMAIPQVKGLSYGPAVSFFRDTVPQKHSHAPRVDQAPRRPTQSISGRGPPSLRIPIGRGFR